VTKHTYVTKGIVYMLCMSTWLV